MKQDKLKNSMIEALKEIPIAMFACKKVGIGRTTYYRWRRKNKKFAKEADAAITEGETLITEMSEGQLISLIRDRNFQALNLWLKIHHPKYGDKIEVTGHLNVKEEPLTPDQEKLVEKALGLAGLLEDKQNQQNYEEDISKLTKGNKS